jgi:hypothetical protein
MKLKNKSITKQNCDKKSEGENKIKNKLKGIKEI